jgi:hypothetical protein
MHAYIKAKKNYVCAHPGAIQIDDGMFWSSQQDEKANMMTDSASSKNKNVFKNKMQSRKNEVFFNLRKSSMLFLLPFIATICICTSL